MTFHTKARAWRESLQLSIADLARLSGYSEISLRWFEAGKTPPRTAAHIAGKQQSKAIPANVWKRYRNVCAGVEAQIKARKQFEFGG
jgi:transcriptional regulator with XRE-family HTH domain